jgi:two-component system OmpR family response regulator
MKIYIVEDNPLYSAVLEQNLLSNGFTDVRRFDDGEACLAQMTKNPDVVLLDYQLGAHKMNGIEIFKEIKRKSRDSKVVLLSNQDEVRIAVESLRLGAFDYIIKGKYAMDNILNALHRVRRIKKISDNASQLKKLKKLFYAGVIGFALLILITYGIELR